VPVDECVDGRLVLLQDPPLSAPVTTTDVDVVVIGGGAAAGLSGVLVLARPAGRS
jgi:hypothetical protein